jgi:hypothetical protein
VLEQWFSHIHLDLLGPLPTSEGTIYMFTVIDRNTRWFGAFPMTEFAAKSCASILIQGWIARYGMPAVITSDRGSQFTSALWDSLCTTLGINHVQTTAYHPQANGMVEWFHCRLKDALRAHMASPTWTAHPPWVLTHMKEDNISPAQTIFSTPIVLPGQFLDANANVNALEIFKQIGMLPKLLMQGITVHGLEMCQTSCLPICCMLLWYWYAETVTFRIWSPSTTAPTAC